MRNEKGQFVNGHKVPKEFREKSRESNLGKHRSLLTEFKKGVHISPKTEFKRGVGHTLAWRKMISKKMKGKIRGKYTITRQSNKIEINCLSCKEKIKIYPSQKNTKKYCSHRCAGIEHKKIVGENHFNWIKDRTKLTKRQVRNDSAYFWWHKQCKGRDKNTCKIKNENCSGYLIVHHILPWRDYKEER
ncbi:MAG: hypothetical protein AABY22_09170, partial [Nanoarchaeota archaeon]